MFVLSQLPLLLYSFITLANAKYYSEGWKPGQPVKSISTNDAPAYTPEMVATSPNAHRPKMGLFDTLLTSGPVNSLLSSVGINMTQKILEAEEKQANMWDKRIPLITDDNYDDLIVNAKPNSEDEVWFIIISTTSAKKDTLSTVFDQRFDEAYDITSKENDLHHVRWGRIDYFNVTRITTKWSVWRGPMIVVLSDRGQTLRFLHIHQLRPEPNLMRSWLENGGYLNLAPWKSIYGPGGDREWIMDYFATVCEKWYNAITSVPTWILYVGSGALATVLVQLLHRGGVTKYEQQKATKRATLGSQGSQSSQQNKSKPSATPRRSRKTSK